MSPSKTRRHVRAFAISAALSMVLLACGQKPGVYVERGPLGAPGSDAEGELGEPLAGEGELDDFGDLDEFGEDAEVGDPAEGTGDGTTGDGTGGNGGATGGSTAQAPSGGGNGGGGGGNGGGGGTRQPQGSDRTGVTEDTITVALHAPVSGAAPLPAPSFERAGDLYWRWITDEKKQKVVGRDNVNVIFADDKYEPSTAIQVCRQLAARAFLLAGGGGTDQIQACGQFAGQARVPYFSAGVTEAGLAGNPWYFAASMSYKQQGPLLAQYVKKNFSGKKVAAVITDTRNFEDAKQGWESGLSGVDYLETRRHGKTDTSWYNGYARDFNDAGVEVVYVLMSPAHYISFAQAASDQDAPFQFVGVGVTQGLNAVLKSGCPHVDDGVFFSPFPALETVGKLDPEFQQAAKKFNVDADDIAWALWGIAKQQHALFEKYEEVFGTDLTREDFREVVANAGRIRTGVFPDVNFTPQNNFGSTGVHVLKADCGSREYKDAGTFKSSF